MKLWKGEWISQIRTTDRNVNRDERNNDALTLLPALSVHSMGTSMVRKPARWSGHQQVHVEREVGDAQVRMDLLHGCAAHDLAGTLGVLDPHAKKRLDDEVDGTADEPADPTVAPGAGPIAAASASR